MAMDTIREVFVPTVGEAWHRYKKEAEVRGISSYDAHMDGIKGMAILAAGVLGNDMSDDEAEELLHAMISKFADCMIDSFQLRAVFVEKIKDPSTKKDMQEKASKLFPWLCKDEVSDDPA